MILHVAITLFSGWLLFYEPAPAPVPASWEILGIEAIGDTCDVTASITFKVRGTTNAPTFFWEFADPGSGTNDTLTIDATRGLSSAPHTFSGPGEYEVHVSFQEPGQPSTRICKKITIGQCCPSNNSSTTTVQVCPDKLPYSWNGNDYSSAGTYNKVFTNVAGCDSVAKLVLEIGSPTPNLGNDTTLCPGEKLVLSAGTYSSYQWQDLSSSSFYEVSQSGQYSVTVSSGEGCTGNDAIQVTFLANCGDIFFPTAVSPNRDGNNDGFRPLGNVTAVRDYRLVVYNRFGQLVFSTTDPLQQWDGVSNGNQLANANFVWTAAYSINGRQKKQKRGSFVMVR